VLWVENAQVQCRTVRTRYFWRRKQLPLFPPHRPQIAPLDATACLNKPRVVILTCLICVD
jgi:hypothetical protein